MKDYFNFKKKITTIDEKYLKNDLSNTWFVQSPIDEEHKYYILKAFLQKLDKNVRRGYLYHEFNTLKDRYKDLESFLETYEIVNKDIESEKLFQYIYDLPSMSKELFEVDAIVLMALELIKKKYTEIVSEITFVSNDLDIVYQNIVDKRKNINIYIEKCNCGYYEHYSVSKNGKIQILESFPGYDLTKNNKENIVLVKTSSAYNSIGTIIPFTLEFLV